MTTIPFVASYHAMNVLEAASDFSRKVESADQGPAAEAYSRMAAAVDYLVDDGIEAGMHDEQIMGKMVFAINLLSISKESELYDPEFCVETALQRLSDELEQRAESAEPW